MLFLSFFFFNNTATTEIYPLSLHDALPISFEYHTIADVILRIAYTAESDEALRSKVEQAQGTLAQYLSTAGITRVRSEEHTSELQSRLHLVCRLLLEKNNKEYF